MTCVVRLQVVDKTGKALYKCSGFTIPLTLQKVSPKISLLESWLQSVLDCNSLGTD